jgi:hypothetical protein
VWQISFRRLIRLFVAVEERLFITVEEDVLLKYLKKVDDVKTASCQSRLRTCKRQGHFIWENVYLIRYDFISLDTCEFWGKRYYSTWNLSFWHGKVSFVFHNSIQDPITYSSTGMIHVTQRTSLRGTIAYLAVVFVSHVSSSPSS